MKRYLLLILLLLIQPSLMARNVELSTVPDRNSIQLTIYNSEDLTLVRETRRLSFKKGSNPLQFSWANTLIDPSSVELRFIYQGEQLELLDTTYPHDKPQMLYWNVHSEISGEATVEISYFTSGIHWSADYTAIANPEETTISLESFVKVRNNSGEEYENAQVRLVVGKINLVEAIAKLARVAPSGVKKLKEEKRDEFRRQVLRSKMMRPKPMAAGAMAMESLAEDMAPKEVEKESLGEYFIYTIEGTETIANGWSKQLRSFHAEEAPMKIEYRFRPQEYGNELVRLYLLRNDKDSKLGTTPLPDGTVRIFRDTGKSGLAYMATQNIQYVPIGDKIELNLGKDPSVLFELVKLKVFRDEILMKVSGANLYRKLEEKNYKLSIKSKVAGWDEHSIYNRRIRNYSGRTINVDIREMIHGDILFRSRLKPKLHDYRTVQFSSSVEPREKRNLFYEVVKRNGRNAKKNNITLETAQISQGE